MRTLPECPRVAERPRVGDWDMDELMTLAEAVRLHWPKGPLTVPSLRNAIRQGALPVCVVAGKHFLTRRGLLSLSQGKTLKDERSAAAPEGRGKRSSSLTRMSREEARQWVADSLGQFDQDSPR